MDIWRFYVVIVDTLSSQLINIKHFHKITVDTLSSKLTNTKCFHKINTKCFHEIIVGAEVKVFLWINSNFTTFYFNLFLFFSNPLRWTDVISFALISLLKVTIFLEQQCYFLFQLRRLCIFLCRSEIYTNLRVWPVARQNNIKYRFLDSSKILDTAPSWYSVQCLILGAFKCCHLLFCSIYFKAVQRDCKKKHGEALIL